MYGTCEICGEYAEVEKREMPMFRGDGKFRPSETDSFSYVACDACERKIAPDRRNRVLAAVLGCLGVAFPLTQMEWVDWYLCEWMGGKVAPIVEFLLMVVPLVLIMCLTKARQFHFQKVPAFLAMRAQGFKLGFKNLGDELRILVFAFAGSASLCFMLFAGVRVRQDTWCEVTGVITHSDVRCARQRSKSGRVTYRLRSKFEYAYKVDGRRYVGTDYSSFVAQTDLATRNPWKADTQVAVWCDPSEPSRSVCQKVEPLVFGKNVLITLFVFVMCWLVQMRVDRGQYQHTNRDPGGMQRG